MIALSSTGLPRSSPRCCAAALDGDLELDDPRRSSSGTWFGSMAAWSKSSRRRTSTSARSASRAAATSVKASASARKSERASSVTTRTRSVSSPAWVLASHQARYAATVSGRRPASSSAATSAGAAPAQVYGRVPVSRRWHAGTSLECTSTPPRCATRRRDARPCRLAGDRRALRAPVVARDPAGGGGQHGRSPTGRRGAPARGGQPLSQGLLVLLMLGFAAHAGLAAGPGGR